MDKQLTGDNMNTIREFLDKVEAWAFATALLIWVISWMFPAGILHGLLIALTAVILWGDIMEVWFHKDDKKIEAFFKKQWAKVFGGGLCK